MNRGWKNSKEHKRKSLDCLQAVNRNKDVNDSSEEVKTTVEKNICSL